MPAIPAVNSTANIDSKSTQSDLFFPKGVHTNLSKLQRLRYAAHSIPANKKMANSSVSSGQHKSKALSRGMEFEEVRIYQAGDDVRNIDWRVTARTQTTYTKSYRDEKEKPIITLVDQRRSLFFGSQNCFKSVYAAELAAFINWSTLKRGDRAGGLVLSSLEIHETRPSRSHKAINQWLQLLAKTNQSIKLDAKIKEPSLNDALQQLNRVARSGTECFIISDFYDVNKETEKQLYLLKRHNPVTLIWLVDPLELQLPEVSQVTLSNGIHKSSMMIDNKIRKAQADWIHQKQESLYNLSIRLNINFIQTEINQALNSVMYS